MRTNFWWDKVSRVTTNPRKARKFIPSKYTRYMVVFSVGSRAHIQITLTEQHIHAGGSSPSVEEIKEKAGMARQNESEIQKKEEARLEVRMIQNYSQEVIILIFV